MKSPDLTAEKTMSSVEFKNDINRGESKYKSITELLSATSREKFDYNLIDPENRESVEKSAEFVRKHIKSVALAVIAAGERLIEVKKLIPHGHWCGWLQAEFSWSERTAQRYMRVAEVFGSKSDTVADLEVGGLYALAARSTPADVRDEIVREIDNTKTLPGLPELKSRISAASKTRNDESVCEPAKKASEGAEEQVADVDEELQHIESAIDFMTERLGAENTIQLTMMLAGIHADRFGKCLFTRLKISETTVRNKVSADFSKI